MRRTSAVDLALLAFAAKRLTRLVTTDWIGEWMLVRPAKKWAYKYDGPVDVHVSTVVGPEWTIVDPSRGYWRTKLISGLDCDWCVGVWAAVLLVLPMPQVLDRIRRPLTKVLAVSQLVGMLAELETGGGLPLEDSQVYIGDFDSDTDDSLV